MAQLFPTNHPLLSIKHGGCYFVYKQENILYIKASGSYSLFTMTDKRTVTATFNLSEIRGKLSEDIFIRVHRSVILNINHITKFVGNVIFVNDEYFPVGRKFRKPLLQRLNLLGNSNRLFVRE